MVSLKFIFSFLIFILSIHTLATIKSWYWTIWWFDIPMHFLGGIGAALTFIWLWRKYFPDFSPSGSENLFALLLTLSFVALIGVLWEFAEFLFDFFISAGGYAKVVQQGAVDTFTDLFFDLLGGLTAAIIFLIGRRKANSVE
jgi:uncharacterized membrane protein YjdF